MYEHKNRQGEWCEGTVTTGSRGQTTCLECGWHPDGFNRPLPFTPPPPRPGVLQRVGMTHLAAEKAVSTALSAGPSLLASGAKKVFRPGSGGLVSILMLIVVGLLAANWLGWKPGFPKFGGGDEEIPVWESPVSAENWGQAPQNGGQWSEPAPTVEEAFPTPEVVVEETVPLDPTPERGSSQQLSEIQEFDESLFRQTFVKQVFNRYLGLWDNGGGQKSPPEFVADHILGIEPPEASDEQVAEYRTPDVAGLVSYLEEKLAFFQDQKDKDVSYLTSLLEEGKLTGEFTAKAIGLYEPVDLWYSGLVEFLRHYGTEGHPVDLEKARKLDELMETFKEQIGYSELHLDTQSVVALAEHLSKLNEGRDALLAKMKPPTWPTQPPNSSQKVAPPQWPPANTSVPTQDPEGIRDLYGQVVDETTAQALVQLWLADYPSVDSEFHNKIVEESVFTAGRGPNHTLSERFCDQVAVWDKANRYPTPREGATVDCRDYWGMAYAEAHPTATVTTVPSTMSPVPRVTSTPSSEVLPSWWPTATPYVPPTPLPQGTPHKVPWDLPRSTDTPQPPPPPGDGAEWTVDPGVFRPWAEACALYVDAVTMDWLITDAFLNLGNEDDTLEGRKIAWNMAAEFNAPVCQVD